MSELLPLEFLRDTRRPTGAELAYQLHNQPGGFMHDEPQAGREMTPEEAQAERATQTTQELVELLRVRLNDTDCELDSLRRNNAIASDAFVMHERTAETRRAVLIAALNVIETTQAQTSAQPAPNWQAPPPLPTMPNPDVIGARGVGQTRVYS